LRKRPKCGEAEGGCCSASPTALLFGLTLRDPEEAKGCPRSSQCISYSIAAFAFTMRVLLPKGGERRGAYVFVVKPWLRDAIPFCLFFCVQACVWAARSQANNSVITIVQTTHPRWLCPLYTERGCHSFFSCWRNAQSLVTRSQEGIPGGGTILQPTSSKRLLAHTGWLASVTNADLFYVCVLARWGRRSYAMLFGRPVYKATIFPTPFLEITSHRVAVHPPLWGLAGVQITRR